MAHQKQLVGERLFPLVSKVEPVPAVRVVGSAAAPAYFLAFPALPAAVVL